MNHCVTCDARAEAAGPPTPAELLAHRLATPAFRPTAATWPSSTGATCLSSATARCSSCWQRARWSWCDAPTAGGGQLCDQRRPQWQPGLRCDPAEGAAILCLPSCSCQSTAASVPLGIHSVTQHKQVAGVMRCRQAGKQAAPLPGAHSAPGVSNSVDSARPCTAPSPPSVYTPTDSQSMALPAGSEEGRGGSGAGAGAGPVQGLGVSAGRQAAD